jgi:hypothetical protein
MNRQSESGGKVDAAAPKATYQCVLFVAGYVHTVSTGEKHDRRCRSEHVRVANGAVGLERPLHALVLLQADAHASVTSVAVEVVDIQTLADAADLALIAVVDVFAVVVVDELAHLAVVAPKLALAVFVHTNFPDRLETNVFYISPAP